MPHSKLALLLALVVSAGNAKAQQSPDWYEKMDYGPYLSLTAEGFTEDNVALKGLTLHLQFVTAPIAGVGPCFTNTLSPSFK